MEACDLSEHRGCIDDPSVPVLNHMFPTLSRHQKISGQTDIHHILPSLQWKFRSRTVSHSACVIDKNIDFPPGVDHFLDSLNHLLFFCHVTGYRKTGAAVFFQSPLSGLPACLPFLQRPLPLLRSLPVPCSIHTRVRKKLLLQSLFFLSDPYNSSYCYLHFCRLAAIVCPQYLCYDFTRTHLSETTNKL